MSRTRHRRGIRNGLVLLCLALAIWAGGLIRFARDIPDRIDAPDMRTDAIVVLTGGSERLNESQILLDRALGEKLFISGVYRGVEVSQLLALPHAVLECCVVLGHLAENTRGNASETAGWIDAQGYASLRLITANYHMPRSVLEFRAAMPDIRLIPHPVFPDAVKMDEWWRWPGTFSLIASEYNKYLIAWMRIAFAGMWRRIGNA